MYLQHGDCARNQELDCYLISFKEKERYLTYLFIMFHVNALLSKVKFLHLKTYFLCYQNGFDKKKTFERSSPSQRNGNVSVGLSL